MTEPSTFEASSFVFSYNFSFFTFCGGFKAWSGTGLAVYLVSFSSDFLQLVSFADFLVLDFASKVPLSETPSVET